MPRESRKATHSGTEIARQRRKCSEGTAIHPRLQIREETACRVTDGFSRWEREESERVFVAGREPPRAFPSVRERRRGFVA